MELKTKLHSKFYSFWKQKFFIDFVLKTQNEEIPCHRLILCHNSKYFFREFSTLKINSNVYVVKFNPNGYFKDVVTFLYSGQIDITIQNIAQIAAIGEYYEIDYLFNFIDKSFTELFTKDNAYELIQNFCTNKVQRYHEKMINIVSHNFDDFKINRIIKVADSKFLSGLLKVLPNYSLDEKVKINDEFTKIHGRYSLSLTDKENLTSIYDFSSNSDSYRFLLFNQCDWMVSSVQRNLLSTIISKRKEEIDYFQSEYNQSFNEISDKDSDSTYYTGKWKVFSYISDISLLKKTNEIDLINYIRTLDGVADMVNPLKYGMINVSHSPPISPLYGGLNIFDNFFYFASKADENNPFINFNIGDSSFLIHGIKLEPVQNHKDKPERPLIGPITVSLYNNEEEDEEGEFIFDVQNPNQLYFFSKDDKMIPSSSIKLTMIGENSAGGWIFRFSYPKIVGMFAFNFNKEE